MKSLRKYLLQNSFLILSIICFLIFNFNYIFGNALLKGDDASSLYYPGIYYLKENLNKGVFPFYTEKIFSGYPIYQYSELGYLNPLRILLTSILPFEKVLPAEYIIFFIIGLIGYFKFLRKKNISDSAIFFSHFIFFYNFQFIGRFVHQQLIFTIMLLPMLIYLSHRFFFEENQNNKKMFIIFSGLLVTLGILYGSFPGVFLLLLGQFLYIVTECVNRKNLKSIIKYYIFLFLTFISFSFYSLYPTYSLFTDSARNIEDFSLTKGSISPVLLGVSFITPFPLGDYDNYLGEKFSSSWFWHEIHTYQGLSFFILCLLGYLYLKNLDFKKFFIVCLSFFIILSTLKYSIFGNIIDFFPFNLFRYHLRFGSVFALSLSILGASIIHKLFHEYEREEIFAMIKNFSILLFPVLIFSYIFYSSINSYETKTLIVHLKNAVISNSIPHFRTSLLATLFLLILILIYKFSHRKSLLVTLPIIAILELVIFSNIIYSQNLVVKNLKNSQIEGITKYYEGKRVAFDNKIYGNQPLYYKSWGVYGYSAYDQKDYKDYMESSGLNVRRYKENNYFLLEKLKVYRVIDENYNIHGVSNGELFSKNYEALDLNENHKKFLIKLDKKEFVQTFIKYDKNIDVLVNSQKVEFQKLDNLFYQFELNEGDNLIEFLYRPKELYLGLILGLLLTIFTLITIKTIKI